VSYHVLPVPVDAAVARAEELLHDASGDPWAEADLLLPLGVLYAYLGRSADARAAIDRSQSVFAGFGAKLILAESAIPAGLVGLTIGDPAAAERDLKAGNEALRAMGVRGFVESITALLAWALYDQGRFDEAAQMIEGPPDPTSSYVAVAALTQAKLLARRGQFAAARRLADEQEALLPPTASPLARATVHEGRAEVERLAGAPGQAAARLRAALQIYEDRRAAALAERARTALASLAAQPDGDLA